MPTLHNSAINPIFNNSDFNVNSSNPTIATADLRYVKTAGSSSVYGTTNFSNIAISGTANVANITSGNITSGNIQSNSVAISVTGTAPTQSATNSSTNIATTAFVYNFNQVPLTVSTDYYTITALRAFITCLDGCHNFTIPDPQAYPNVVLEYTFWNFTTSTQIMVSSVNGRYFYGPNSTNLQYQSNTANKTTYPNGRVMTIKSNGSNYVAVSSYQ
jgi:hypothetical protein